MNSRNVVIVGAMLFSAAASAEDRRQLDAHEHGVVGLNIALEGKALLVELRSPAVNIIGFEHAPSTEEQKAMVAEQSARLESLASVLSIPAEAGCEQVSTSVALVGESDDAHEGESDGHGHDEHDEGHGHEKHEEEHGHDEHEEEHGHDEHEEEHGHDEHEEDHGHDKHEDEHGHEKHEDEHDHEEHAHEKADAHSEFHGDYSLTCENPAAIDSVTVNLMESYPSIEKVVVAGVAPDGQFANTLTKSETVVEFP